MSTHLGADPNQTTAGPRHRPRRAAMAFAAVGVVAVIAAGCGGSSSKTSAPKAATPIASTSHTPASSTITATLTEFRIALSSMKLKAGTYTFHVVNAGKTVHNIEFNGPGVADKALAHNLNPGKSANLTVTLEAGRYDVFCPVADHKQLGMNLELTVAGPAKTSAPGSNPAKKSSPTTAKSGGGSGY
jgi:uncharacterized cupredoxin-like copper-binding protein